ncbi:cutinase-domain-containing protein [Schizothecium vesticola]|uniref:Cutinase n=1 Tax=Schizothecium vesticola TaxID=314040 RepID=A0AA40EL60_9PEZI|nr:cutinase-domain-containing protein [Schizothecium vesticola]
MKFFITFSLFGALVAALPALSPEHIEAIRSWDLVADSTRALETRQSSNVRNELQTGGTCPPVILIWARGSTEEGNMGTLGPALADALEANYGANKVWVQGVGGAYKADLLGNFLTDGTTVAAITEGKNLLKLANTKCPSSKVVMGGYSQGAALLAAAIRDSSAVIREQIKGVTLFGYTKNQQNKGLIPNYPASRLAVYCAVGDRICEGTLIVTPAHLEYIDEAQGPAPKFLIARIAAS